MRVRFKSIEKYLAVSGSNEEKLEAIEKLLGHIPMAVQGLEELRYVLKMYSVAFQTSLLADNPGPFLQVH